MEELEVKTTEIEERSIENPAVPLTDPEAALYLGGVPSSSGVPVNRTSVLGSPPLWRALNLISNKIGRLPLSVYKATDDGGREEDVNNPAWWLLKKQPNNLMSPYTWKQVMIFNSLLHGNSYSYIMRDDFGRPQELIPLDSCSTFPVFNKDNELEYVTRVGAEERRLLAENVIHFKGLGNTGVYGYDIISILREALGLGLAMTSHAANYFRNNCSVGPLIYCMEGKLPGDGDVRAEWRRNFESMHKGIGNSGRVLLLEMNIKPCPMEINHQQSQFLESREFDVKMIAMITGVPGHKLGVAVNANYNSLSEENQAFLDDCIDPLLVMAEQELDVKLLRESSRKKERKFVEFNRLALEALDLATQTETLIAQTANGLRTDNEARALLNLPSAGPDGDRRKMPTNIQFVDVHGVPPQPQLTLLAGEVDEEAATGDPSASEPIVEAETLNKLQRMTDATVRRLVGRLAKSSKGQRGAEWLKEHRSVFFEALPVCDTGTIDDLLGGLADELRAVLPEQQAAVIENIDVSEWTERILG